MFQKAVNAIDENKGVSKMKDDKVIDFTSSKTLVQAVDYVKGCGVFHKVYCHYTTLDGLEKIISSQRMRLTRCDSTKFDDLIEGKKYGDAEARKRFFLASFSFSGAENAAMWGLYSPKNYKAIRIVVPCKAMEKWDAVLKNPRTLDVRIAHSTCESGRQGKRIAASSGGIADVIYASVKMGNDEKNRSNSLCWNDVHTPPISNLDKGKNKKRVTGLVKDYEWRFEYEARVFVSTKKVGRFDAVTVPIPMPVFESMSFVLSPWVNDGEYKFVKGLIREWFQRARINSSLPEDRLFRKSVLTGGLKNLGK